MSGKVVQNSFFRSILSKLPDVPDLGEVKDTIGDCVTDLREDVDRFVHDTRTNFLEGFPRSSAPAPTTQKAQKEVTDVGLQPTQESMSTTQQVVTPQNETLTKSDFLSGMEGQSIDVRLLRAQMALSNAQVQGMDKNRDGRLSGQSEMGQLWNEIDELDQNGDRGSIAKRIDGELTKAGIYATIAKVNANFTASALGGTNPSTQTGNEISSAGSIEEVTSVSSDSPSEWNQNVVDAALDLIENHGEGYGVAANWYNVDPNHAVGKTGDTGSVLKGSWKCNLFFGNVLHHAGMEAPFYDDREVGYYPHANQIYKWSDAYAEQYGTEAKFEMRQELDLTSPEYLGLSQAEKEQAVRDMLATAEPGDLLLVDHMGDQVSNGGHCRVVIENDLATGGKMKNAQASRHQALVRDEGISSYLKKERIWILRANKPQEDFEAGTLVGATD